MLKKINQDHLIILKNLSYLTLMRFFNIGFKFLLVAYLIRVLGDKNYGLVTWLDSIIQYFLMIINFGFNIYAAKYIVDFKDKKVFFARWCFCKGQTGFYKINTGNLSISRLENTSYQMHLTFTVDEVPQIIKEIKQNFKQIATFYRVASLYILLLAKYLKLFETISLRFDLRFQIQLTPLCIVWQPRWSCLIWISFEAFYAR